MQKKKVIMGAVTTALTLAMGTAAYAASSDIFFQERVDIGEGCPWNRLTPQNCPRMWPIRLRSTWTWTVSPFCLWMAPWSSGDWPGFGPGAGDLYASQCVSLCEAYAREGPLLYRTV